MSLFGALISLQDNSPIDLTELFNGHEAVDLGVIADNGNHLLIATCNVGASKPEDYGDYFIWGSVTPNTKDNCAWLNTPYQTTKTTSTSSDNTKFTKYVGSTTSSYKDPSATDEDALKTVLDLEDDAAHVIMGGSWRMPTISELQKLADKSNVWGTKNSVNGRKWTSGNQTLFIPAAGYRLSTSFSKRGSYGYVWSSNIASPYHAENMDFYNSNIRNTEASRRCRGHSVRGVIELTEEQYQAWLDQNT